MNLQRYSYLYVALALLALVNPARGEECKLKEVASLPMTDRIAGMIVVEARVAGTPRYFLVDTGGVFSSIYDDVAGSLHLQTREMDQGVEIYRTVTGVRHRQYASVPDFTLGTMHVDQVPMIVEQRDAGDDGKIDGILGPDILSKFDLDFDFSNHKLNLFSPDHCEGKVVYWSDAYVDVPFEFSDLHIILPMKLDDHEVSATLDTGAAFTSLNERVSRKVFGLDENSPGAERSQIPDDLTLYRYRFKSLSVGGLAVGNPLIEIFEDKAAEAFNRSHTDKLDFEPEYASRLVTADLLLGMDVIRNLHVYVAYSEHKIYFTAADAH